MKISGARQEVDDARSRLVASGVDVDKIMVSYTTGPAYVEVVENTLGKRRH